MDSPWKCCPDNVTAATPTGCGCKFSEHGCCEDGYTNATGPEYEGCPCSTFRTGSLRYANKRIRLNFQLIKILISGCCDDGVTIAKGHNKEGKYKTPFYIN